MSLALLWGLLGSLGNFIKKNWKIVLGVILLVAGYIIINNHINGLKKTAYNNGVAATNQLWNTRIAAENAANQKYQTQLQNITDMFGKQFQQSQDQRNNQADTHIHEIPIIIKNDPNLANCSVPQQVLDERNSIRKLGPPGIEQ